MIEIILMLIVYIILYGFYFIKVSKINKSYINSWTIDVAYEIGIKMIPFMMAFSKYSNFKQALWIFVAVLYINIFGKYFGYKFGYACKSFKFIDKLLKGQEYAKIRYKYYVFFSLIAGITTFIILASKGGGLYNWIFHNRESYISGRAGNGIWYILFELMILVMVSLIFSLANDKKIYALMFILPLTASYFTGSKLFIIGVIILIILYYDTCIKKIKTIELAVIGIIMFVLLIYIMLHQSGITLLEYSDYYYHFLLFLDRQISGGWDYTYGLITLENFYWLLIPRALFPNKPYVYGIVRIVALFYSQSIIIAGNTPSFSEFIMPYADFGIIGVFIYSFLENCLKGMLEKGVRSKINNREMNFNILFLYIIFCFLAPASFNIIYILLFCIFFRIVQKCRFGNK